MAEVILESDISINVIDFDGNEVEIDSAYNNGNYNELTVVVSAPHYFEPTPTQLAVALAKVPKDQLMIILSTLMK